MLPQYWSELKKSAIGWVHPDDERFLRAVPHSFNLDFPPPAFVGDVIKAKVIVLTANGGYKAEHTPMEFFGKDSEQLYLSRLKNPTGANWAEVAPYYGRVNYSSLLFDGSAASVNACAYRSPKISEEPNNRKLIAKLPSFGMHRKWLTEVVLPDVNAGRRLILGSDTVSGDCRARSPLASATSLIRHRSRQTYLPRFLKKSFYFSKKLFVWSKNN